MRKYLLLGTIFVATSALAFSGVFGGGSGSSKQATYSGGVDAIGVHFNGKPADSEATEPVTCEAPYILNESTNECECPVEKQCGEYCCGGDNVCNKETQECCSEALDYCCPSGQTASRMNNGGGALTCCPGIVYDGFVKSDGTPRYDFSFCCLEGEVYLKGIDNYNGDTLYQCCAGTVYCQRYDIEGNCMSKECGPLNCQNACVEEYEDGQCKQSACCLEGQTPSLQPWGPYCS